MVNSSNTTGPVDENPEAQRESVKQQWSLYRYLLGLPSEKKLEQMGENQREVAEKIAKKIVESRKNTTHTAETLANILEGQFEKETAVLPKETLLAKEDSKGLEIAKRWIDTIGKILTADDIRRLFRNQPSNIRTAKGEKKLEVIDSIFGKFFVDLNNPLWSEGTPEKIRSRILGKTLEEAGIELPEIDLHKKITSEFADMILDSQSTIVDQTIPLKGLVGQLTAGRTVIVNMDSLLKTSDSGKKKFAAEMNQGELALHIDAMTDSDRTDIFSIQSPPASNAPNPSGPELAESVFKTLKRPPSSPLAAKETNVRDALARRAKVQELIEKTTDPNALKYALSALQADPSAIGSKASDMYKKYEKAEEFYKNIRKTLEKMQNLLELHNISADNLNGYPALQELLVGTTVSSKYSIQTEKIKPETQLNKIVSQFKRLLLNAKAPVVLREPTVYQKKDDELAEKLTKAMEKEEEAITPETAWDIVRHRLEKEGVHGKKLDETIAFMQAKVEASQDIESDLTLLTEQAYPYPGDENHEAEHQWAHGREKFGLGKEDTWETYKNNLGEQFWRVYKFNIWKKASYETAPLPHLENAYLNLRKLHRLPEDNPMRLPQSESIVGHLKKMHEVLLKRMAVNTPEGEAARAAMNLPEAGKKLTMREQLRISQEYLLKAEPKDDMASRLANNAYKDIAKALEEDKKPGFLGRNWERVKGAFSGPMAGRVSTAFGSLKKHKNILLWALSWDSAFLFLFSAALSELALAGPMEH